VADVVGYYTAGPGDRFTGVTPTRILDSRNGTGGYTGPWGPGEIHPVTVVGVASVPAEATAHQVKAAKARRRYLEEECECLQPATR